MENNIIEEETIHSKKAQTKNKKCISRLSDCIKGISVG
jgi:hypothetical protein